MAAGTPELVVVAAMARRRVIGRSGGMPWHLPADLRHFKALTLGHPVVMGRRTFESIGSVLPGRRNIVISRSARTVPDGALLASSLDEAVEMAGSERVMIIGGGEIYRQALPRASCMELTLIAASVEGDTYFPEWSWSDWRLERMQVRPADAANSCAMSFCRFVRRADVRGYNRMPPVPLR